MLISKDFLLISRALNLCLSLTAQSLSIISTNLPYFLDVLIIFNLTSSSSLNLIIHQSLHLFFDLNFVLEDYHFSFANHQFMFLSLKFALTNQNFFSTLIPKCLIVHHF